MIVTRFKSNVRETWRVILVSEADIFFTESLRILAERLSQSKIGLPLRLICYDSPPEEVGVFSTEIKQRGCSPLLQILPHLFDHVFFFCDDFFILRLLLRLLNPIFFSIFSPLIFKKIIRFWNCSDFSPFGTAVSIF